MLTDNQKQMIADLLSRTKTRADIKDFCERIRGNAYGSEETVKHYKSLAITRIKLGR